MVPNPVLEASGSDLIDLCEDSFHHMGATRMADAPQRGVVDENLQLFGIRNGYVCSSSVFPTSGCSNPTHTIIALASRLAEHLATMQTPVRVATSEAKMWAKQSSLRWSSEKSAEKGGLGCGTIRANQGDVLERN